MTTKPACPVGPLSYYGGKQAQGKAAWIASLLPWSRESTYCEPFGGMMSVLLHRQPVRTEIYNDLDGNVVNWWWAVRNHRQEFGQMVEAMPHSRKEFEWAFHTIRNNNGTRLDRALAFHVLCLQGVIASPYKTGWSIGIDHKPARWRSERVACLAERIWNVHIECKPAHELLNMLAYSSETVIYCDPPYPTSAIDPYQETTDYSELTEALLSQTGSVAVSGYGDEWQHLGWQRHEKESWTTRWGEHAGPAQARTEVLWTNYEVSDRQPSLFTEEDNFK